jgi:hypothetical protein
MQLHYLLFCVGHAHTICMCKVVLSDKLLASVLIVNVKAITLLGLKPQELLVYAGGLVP